MNKKTQTKKQRMINLLIFVFLLIIPLAFALPFQSHSGEEIIGEMTQADLSCSNIRQSDVLDDSNFCVDVDTQCNTPGLCTQLCLGDVCIGSFAEINPPVSGDPGQMCNATNTCDQLCIGNTCITSFDGVGGSSDIVGACSTGFINEIEANGNIKCRSIISGDMITFS